MHIPKRPGEPDETFADISKSKKILGWAPQVSFEDGVAKMVADIEKWRHAPLWDPQSISKATETWFKYMA